MKKNSNNGKDTNDPNINGVEENLTENQSQKTESAAEQCANITYMKLR